MTELSRQVQHLHTQTHDTHERPSCTRHAAELCHIGAVDEMDRIIYLPNEKRETGRRERPEKR